jgi:hypothetical protein
MEAELQFADKPKQTGETLRYTMTYRAGGALAEGDSLIGTPIVKIWEWANGVTGIERTSTMLAVAATRLGNKCVVWIKGGTHGKKYKISFYCDTNFGEKAVEADLILTVKDY